jgi:hopanoid biosynthesis associated radical SAM protein HpnH
VSIPAIQKTRIALYIITQMLTGSRKFPLVLMLEPLFRCNLRCRGCGKISYPEEILKKRLSLAECLDAADECGAPVVSIAGGEPLLLADIPQIVTELAARKKFVYLCTNALLLPKRIDEFAPSPYLTFNIHLDGLAERHDALVCQPGVFERAVSAIRLLLSRGFRVTTNTTLFGDETPEAATRFFDTVTQLGVEGMTVAPAFSYEAARDQDHFFSRRNTRAFFSQVLDSGRGRGWRFNHSRLYLEFLAGKRQYTCTPWGNPTRNIFGWQRPCYLLDDGYAATFDELMRQTPWEKYGAGRDRRCQDCMVHCGFEPSAVLDMLKNPLGALFPRTSYSR